MYLSLECTKRTENLCLVFGEFVHAEETLLGLYTEGMLVITLSSLKGRTLLGLLSESDAHK